MKDVDSQFAEVNGIRLHYVSKGQGDLIVFIHGFPEFWAAWEKQLVEFGRDHQAVAYDLRGYNLSSKPDGVDRYHIKHHVEDLRCLVEHLGHRKCHLVAHDWGGGVAWSFALRHPECVEKLIIVNSPHPALFARELLNNPAQQKASEYMLLFRSAEAEEKLSNNDYEYLFAALSEWGSQWTLTDSLRRRYQSAWSQPGALTGGLNFYRASPLYPPTSERDVQQIQAVIDLPVEMLTVTVPSLVIWGEQDRALLPDNLDGLDEYVTDVTVKRIPDATHWVVHEQPERVNDLIRRFIQA
jgi:pimeloyl-ACP methyl ester carboxylesterase